MKARSMSDAVTSLERAQWFMNSAHRRDIATLAVVIEDAVRAEREACVKIAEDQQQAFLSPDYAVGQPMSSHAERFACGCVADAIRARNETEK
jgi:hypothetical protein